MQQCKYMGWGLAAIKTDVNRVTALSIFVAVTALIFFQSSTAVAQHILAPRSIVSRPDFPSVFSGELPQGQEARHQAVRALMRDRFSDAAGRQDNKWLAPLLTILNINSNEIPILRHELRPDQNTADSIPDLVKQAAVLAAYSPWVVVHLFRVSESPVSSGGELWRNDTFVLRPAAIARIADLIETNHVFEPDSEIIYAHSLRALSSQQQRPVITIPMLLIRKDLSFSIAINAAHNFLRESIRFITMSNDDMVRVFQGVGIDLSQDAVTELFKRLDNSRQGSKVPEGFRFSAYANHWEYDMYEQHFASLFSESDQQAGCRLIQHISNWFKPFISAMSLNEVRVRFYRQTHLETYHPAMPVNMLVLAEWLKNSLFFRSDWIKALMEVDGSPVRSNPVLPVVTAVIDRPLYDLRAKRYYAQEIDDLVARVQTSGVDAQDYTYVAIMRNVTHIHNNEEPQGIVVRIYVINNKLSSEDMRDYFHQLIGREEYLFTIDHNQVVAQGARTKAPFLFQFEIEFGVFDGIPHINFLEISRNDSLRGHGAAYALVDTIFSTIDTVFPGIRQIAPYNGGMFAKMVQFWTELKGAMEDDIAWQKIISKVRAATDPDSRERAVRPHKQRLEDEPPMFIGISPQMAIASGV